MDDNSSSRINVNKQNMTMLMPKKEHEHEHSKERQKRSTTMAKQPHAWPADDAILNNIGVGKVEGEIRGYRREDQLLS